jgi:hypothetical protein
VRKVLHIAVIAASLGLFAVSAVQTQAQVNLLAIGELANSKAGAFTDLSGLDNTLESGVPANLLGGLGSGLAWASGDTFLAIPDRGPNAVAYDALIDSTTSYIPRFHTIKMNLDRNKGAGLPFILTPKLKDTTLLYSRTPLVYGTGEGLAVGSGVPPQNTFFKHYFSGRSDNFDPAQNSGDAKDARFDPEGIRVSKNGDSVFISDEYGPYVYQFERWTGKRIRVFNLPENLFSPILSAFGNDEIALNVTGRTANKGMEGLAITPDGKTLVGVMQAALIQDNLLGGAAKKLLRLVKIDIKSGKTNEYAYALTTGSGVSEIVALNQHEFLLDERDGAGRGDNSNAVNKQIYKIDLKGAVDITDMDGLEAATHAVTKTLFLDVVAVLVQNGYTPAQVPAKIEGIALGEDVRVGGKRVHTLWVSNDNDFLKDFNGPDSNPNQFFVFGFTDAELSGSKYVPQELR